jgi:hypothetical protein
VGWSCHAHVIDGAPIPASKVSTRIRHISTDVQVIDISVTTTEGARLTMSVPLDEVPTLVTGLRIAYEACRPPIPDVEAGMRTAQFWGMKP